MKSCVTKKSNEACCYTVIPRSPALWDDEESIVGLLRRWLSGNPHKIPPRTYHDSVVMCLVGMTTRVCHSEDLCDGACHELVEWRNLLYDS